MYRSLAIIIAAVVATSPAVGESEHETFYTSLRELGSQCKHAAAALEHAYDGTRRSYGYDDAKAMFACSGFIIGVKHGLRFDESKPAVMCIKRLTVTGNDYIRAFSHYYSTLQKTGAGQKILCDFERTPGEFTMRALGAIYGCTHNQPGFAAEGTRIESDREQDIDVSGVTPTEEPPISVPGMVVEKELNFDDLIPEKKPR